VDVHYVRLAENTGGAGGFHEGMKRALDAGFDWLWLMDDDAMLAPDALAALVKSKRSLEALGDDPFLLNSLVLANDPADDDRLAVPLQEFAANGDPKRGVYHWRLSEVRHMVNDGLYRWACPFNGTFVSARLASRIGLPNREFFIWGDERDFFWRTARRFKIGTVVDSRIYHPTSRETVFDWKQYYDIRNQIVLNRRFRYTHLRNGRLILLSLVRGARHGRWGLTLALRAIRDGLAGRLGKRDDLQP
jgi:GT2 family glycosyltransferase